jgi:hypothetical protein
MRLPSVNTRGDRDTILGRGEGVRLAYPLYGAEGDFKAKTDSLDDARRHLARLKAWGAFSVKSYNQPRRDQRQWYVKGARERSCRDNCGNRICSSSSRTCGNRGKRGAFSAVSTGRSGARRLTAWA